MTLADPQAALALFETANARLAASDWDSAEQLFVKALAHNPLFPQAHANLGYLQDRRGAWAQAEASFKTAIAMAPELCGVRINLGALLLQQKRLIESESVFAAALALEPDSAALWSNLGSLYIAMQREEDAETCLQKAIQLDPQGQKATFNLAYLRLRHGRFREGWHLFESRDWYTTMARHFSFPRWQGESLQGRTLMLSFEAGHGDVIQFCRYATLLKARGAARLDLVCHPALVRLMRSLPALDNVIGFTGEVPRTGYDYWLPLLSAPYYCHSGQHSDSDALGNSGSEIPVYGETPYLYAEPNLCSAWAGTLPARPQLRVGLVWQGNPAFENDRDRSLPGIETLRPLWQARNLPGLAHIAFISLQKGRGEDHAQAFGMDPETPLTCVGHHMQDFADAAAIVSQLDLVISVDTAMAHLAGAIGTPCWTLLPHYMTDWRWGATGTCSGWYPGEFQLFRQGSDQRWEPVIARVAQALAEWHTNQMTPPCNI